MHRRFIRRADAVCCIVKMEATARDEARERVVAVVGRREAIFTKEQKEREDK